TSEYIEKTKAEMPVMPGEWRSRLSSLGLATPQIETLLEAEVEFDRFSFLPLLEANLKDKELAQFLVNWHVNVFIPLMREGTFKAGDLQSLTLERAIYDLLKANKLSSTNAKSLFEDLVKSESLPGNIEKYAEEKGYIQVSDEGEVAKIVEKVLAEN